MTLAIAHHEDGLNIIDAVHAEQPPFNPANVVENFVTLLKEYRVREVTGDAYSGEWVVAAFKEHAIRYRTSPINKSTIYLEALSLFTRGQVELPDQRILQVELTQLERRTARGGKDSVDHPPRCHDDLANATCGALVEVARVARVHRRKKIGSPVGIYKAGLRPSYER